MNMHPSYWSLQKVHQVQSKSAAFSASSLVKAQPLQYCNSCDYDTPPEGGIQLTTSKWICSKCWVERTRHKRHK